MTTRVSSLLIVGALASGLMAAQPLLSAEKAAGKGDAAKGDNVDKEKRGSTPQTQGVAQAAVADQLVVYGDRNKDPLALITAARMMNELGIQEGKREFKTEGGTAGAKPEGAPRDDSVSGILSRARQYAGGRKDIIALADEAAKTTTRGRLEGPGVRRTSVNANGSDIYVERYRGGEPATVSISGDGDTDLDLIVRDENGRVICNADGPGDRETCSWTPRWTGPFRIEVRNLGNVYNRYRLYSN